MGDLRDPHLNDPIDPPKTCPTREECIAIDWCKGGCHSNFLEQFQPLTVSFPENMKMSDYIALRDLLKKIGEVEEPSHNVAVIARRRHRNED